ncbi:MAG: DNA polymerase, partial [Cloacibacillus sp.]
CTHHDPNLAQVPAAGSLYGHECRALFTALPGYSLLGCDASGLELRCLAHYMARYDGGHYADVILHGDIHWENALALGLLPKGTKRDKDNPDHEYARNKVAKRFIYAFLYGAGALKIGTVCGLTDADRDKYAADKRRKSLIHRLQENEQPCDDETIAYTLKGTDLKNTFLRTLPALDSLIKDVQNKAKETKKLRGLDGRILHVRSQHSALNTLLQSAGAVSVKQATVNLWAHLRREDLADKVKQVAHVHDEFQCLVANGYEDRVGALAVQSFRDAGQQFNFRCPLDGEYKYGQNWADTH